MSPSQLQTVAATQVAVATTLIVAATTAAAAAATAASGIAVQTMHFKLNQTQIHSQMGLGIGALGIPDLRRIPSG